MDAHNKMTGELEPGLLLDMLQLMSRRKNLNGVIEIVSGSTAGRIWLSQGMMIAAEWRGRQGEAAVETILTLTQGTFSVQDAMEFPARTIERDSVAVLMSCARAIGKAQLTPPVASAPGFEVSKSKLADPRPRTVPVSAVSAPVSASASGSLHSLVQSLRVAPEQASVAKAPVLRRSSARAWGRWAAVSAAAAAFMLISFVLVPRIVSARAGKEVRPEASAAAATPVPAQRVMVSVPVKGIPGAEEPAGWPVMNLSALVACDRTGGCAILNGQLVGVGGEVDGIRLRAIRSSGVILEYRGKSRTIAMERRMAF